MSPNAIMPATVPDIPTTSAPWGWIIAATLPPAGLGLGILGCMIFDTQAEPWERWFFAHLTLLYLLVAGALGALVIMHHRLRATRELIDLHILQTAYRAAHHTTKE